VARKTNVRGTPRMLAAYSWPSWPWRNGRNGANVRPRVEVSSTVMAAKAAIVPARQRVEPRNASRRSAGLWPKLDQAASGGTDNGAAARGRVRYRFRW